MFQNVLMAVLVVGLLGALGFALRALVQAMAHAMDKQAEQCNDVLRLLASKDYHHFVPSANEEKRKPERSVVPPEVTQMESEYERAEQDPFSLGPDLEGEPGPLMNLGRK